MGYQKIPRSRLTSKMLPKRTMWASGRLLIFGGTILLGFTAGASSQKAAEKQVEKNIRTSSGEGVHSGVPSPRTPIEILEDEEALTLGKVKFGVRNVANDEEQRATVASVTLVDDQGNVFEPERTSTVETLKPQEARSGLEVDLSRLADGFYRAQIVGGWRDQDGTGSTSKDIVFAIKNGRVKRMDTESWLRDSRALFATKKEG